MAKKEENKGTLTRAQKTEATKGIIKELLAIKPMRHNELIDEVAKLYVSRYESAETENANDVRGRVGSVLDIMKKESDVMSDGGTYALKARLPQPPTSKQEEKETELVAEPVKKTRARTKKTEAKPQSVPVEENAENKEKTEEAPAPKKRTRGKKAEPVEEKASEGKTEENTPAKEIAPKGEETPKKRGRKPKVASVKEEKTESKSEEKAAPVVEKAEKKEEVKAAPLPVPEPVAEKAAAPLPTVAEKGEEKTGLIVKPKAEVVQKGVVMDMSFLFGDKAVKAAQKPLQEERKAPAPVEKGGEEKKSPTPTQKEEKPAQKEEKKAPVPVQKREERTEKKEEPVRVSTAKRGVRSASTVKKAEKPMTAEEKLKDSFLKRMRVLGGDYFEYYSVYLLERYSMKNGRRLEGLRISGGDHDGGIDGEIELTDKFGFKETIYIQSKNWDPEKGKEENWVVGETLLQQFIGACACRQAKEGKQHCRGIFITTSRFTPDAQRILEDMSEKIIGYDGNDLFDAAKECEFGLIKKNGEWCLDEKLLSGSKAFFQMM